LIEYKSIASSLDGKETLIVTTDSVPAYYICKDGKKEWLHCEAAVDWLLKHNYFDKILKFDLLPMFSYMTFVHDTDNEKQAKREVFLEWFEKNHQEAFSDYIADYYGLCIY
jgi:hypothetical protein